MFKMFIDDDVHLELQDEHHADMQFALVDRNRAFIGAWLPWAWMTRDLSQTRAYLASSRRTFADGTDIVGAIFYRGEIAGGIGLHIRNQRERKAEIGYWLGEEFTGKGIMTRAARKMVDYAFATLHMNRVFVRAAVDNRPSRAIPERLGFMQEGTFRQDGFISDADHNPTLADMVYYGLLAEDRQQPETAPEFAWGLGDGIELRLLEERHTHQVFNLVDANRAYLRRWLPWLDDNTEPRHTRDFIKNALNRYVDRDGFVVGIWVNGELAGVVDYHGWDWKHCKTELGYWLAEPFTGRGIMTRAVNALVDYAFAIGLNRVKIMCATGNRASCAIPERLGFQLEGVQRQSEWLYDHFVDWNVYAMLAKDWQQEKSE